MVIRKLAVALALGMQAQSAYAQLVDPYLTSWQTFFDDNLTAGSQNPVSCYAGGNFDNPCSCSFSGRSISCSGGNINTMILFRNRMRGEFPTAEVNLWLNNGATLIDFSNDGSTADHNQFEYPAGETCLAIDACTTSPTACDSLDLTSVTNAAGDPLIFCTPPPTPQPTTSPTPAPTTAACKDLTLKAGNTQKKLQKGSSTDSRDGFGSAVAIDGNWMIVGAKFDQKMGINTGTAHMYLWNGVTETWEFHSTIFDSGASEWAIFGSSVAISGDYAVVGSPRDDMMGTNSGSGVLFHFDGTDWVQTAKLYASDGTTADNAGMSVAIDGALIAIGNPKDSRCGSLNMSGSFTVFKDNGSGYEEQGTFCAETPGAKQMCGKSLSISGTKIMVGCNKGNTAFIANFDDSAELGTPTVTYDTFPMPAELQPASWFGMDVCLDGNLAVVGAPFANQGIRRNAGEAYVYTSDGSGTWTAQARLVDNYPLLNDRMGRAVACSETFNVVLVGAYRDSFFNRQSAGTVFAYHFDGSAWSRTGKIRESTPKAYGEYGRSIAMSGKKVAIGEPKADDHGYNAGLVTTMQLEPPSGC